MAERQVIVNVNADPTAPATVLVERIGDLFAGFFRPWQIRRIAKAEAAADIIRAQTKIEINELQRRAVERFIHEEAKKQENIEQITEKAIPLLENDAKPQDISSDWLMDFFDKCRTASDAQIQEVWARLLAGEANCSGSYSRRTIGIVSTMSQRDAHLFATVCRFVWTIEGHRTPLIFDLGSEYLKSLDLYYLALSHLHDIGLIRLPTSALDGFRFQEPEKVEASYHHERFEIDSFGADIELGRVMLTSAGRELCRVCGDAEPIPGLRDSVIDHWSSKGFAITPLPSEH